MRVDAESLDHTHGSAPRQGPLPMSTKRRRAPNAGVEPRFAVLGPRRGELRRLPVPAAAMSPASDRSRGTSSKRAVDVQHQRRVTRALLDEAGLVCAESDAQPNRPVWFSSELPAPCLVSQRRCISLFARHALFIAWLYTTHNSRLRPMQPRGRQARPAEAAYRRAFGVRLRALREASGVSQENLAHSTGISRRYLSGIERGEANPSLDQLVRLARSLKADMSELLPPGP